MDFVKHFRPHLSESNLVRTGRAATIGFMLLSALWAPQIARFPSLWQYLQSILSYITPPVVVIFLFGILWRKGTAPAATITLAVGIPLGVTGWVLNEIMAVYQIQFLYGCGLMTLISALIFICTSLITAASLHDRAAALTWGRDHWRVESQALKKLVWYRNYRYQSAGLLAVAILIVSVWW